MRAQARSRWVTTDVADDQAHDDRQSGQGNLEYVGMVVVVAALVVALIAVFPSIGDDLTCKFSQAIASITGGSADCSGGGSEAKEARNGDRGEPAPAGAVPNPSPRPQSPPTPPAPGVPWGLDPNSDLVKTMQSTPRGRQTLQWLVDNYVYVDVNSNEKGAKWDGRKIVLGNGYDNVPVLIHEANHARYSREGRSANARKLGRDDYIDGKISEEADGVVQQIEAAQALRNTVDTESRVPGSTYYVPTQPGETEYNSAFQGAKNNGASDADARQAGYDAVKQLFYIDPADGGFAQSTDGKSYPEAKGEYWDSLHPCVLGFLFC